MAAREHTDPTTAANAVDRLRALQDLFGAMHYSGAFVGLERICPPRRLEEMMQAVSAGRSEALPSLLSPCLLALGTLGPLTTDQTTGPSPGQSSSQTQSQTTDQTQSQSPGQSKKRPVSVTVSLPTSAARLAITPAVPVAAGDAADAFPVTFAAAQQGTVRLTLTDRPVYIEETPKTTPPGPAERRASPFGAHPATYRGETPPFALADAIGLGWHRGVAWWVDIQSDADLAAGRFDFSRLDAELAALSPDMQALITIMLPARLRADGPQGALRRSDDPKVESEGKWALAPGEAAYEAFVRALVTRYGRNPPAGLPRVAFWQVENELDLSRARSDAAGYARLLTRTRAVIKAVDPAATVLAAGVSGEDPEANFTRAYLPLLRRLGGQGMDAFDMHFFGRCGDYKALAGYYALVRRSLDATGFSGLPVWMTETGTYSGAPAGLPPQTEDEQAAELVRTGVTALGLGVRKVFWAMVREGFHFQNDRFDHMGLTTDARVSPQRPDGRPKQAFFTFRLLCAKLAGCDPTPQRLSLGPAVHAYRFRTPQGRQVLVAWADPGDG